MWGRARIAGAERALAEVPGVTLLVYDQACAAELRRLRKRGRAPERPQRVVINEAVCEGCGDCGAKSGCLSVHPVETELGRKTQIDQASCNIDYSCLDGDCPSFVTVRAPAGGVRERLGPQLPADIPEPERKAAIGIPGGYGIVATGIGGTGVVMLNQVLATAAFLDGLAVTGLDQTGLSQKAGTPADLFGYATVRRTERRLAAGYEAEMRAVLAGLSPATHATAVELARLPLAIRGYEQIKLAAVARYESERERLRPLLRRPDHLGQDSPVTSGRRPPPRKPVPAR